MRKAKRVELSRALLESRRDILKSCQEHFRNISRLNSEKGSKTRNLFFEEMKVFLDCFLQELEDRDRRGCDASLRRMAGMFFRVGLPHSILTQTQIRLKRILIDTVIQKFKGHRQDIAQMSNLIESDIDINRIFLSDELETLAMQTLEASERNYRELIEEMEDLVVRIDPEGKVVFVNSASQVHLGLSSNRLVGRSLENYIHPSDRDKLRRAVKDGVTKKKVSEFICEVKRKKDERTILNFRMYPVTGDGGGVIELKGNARDITRTKNLENELRKKVDEIKMQWEVGRTVTSSVNLEVLLDRTLDSLCKIFNYPVCTVFVYDEKKNELSPKTGRGYRKNGVRSKKIKMGEGVAGWVAREREILLVPDVEINPGHARAAKGVRSRIAVPLLYGNKLMGVLDIESPERDAFDKEDMIRLSLFASQIAGAINNARLFEELQTANKELNEANLQLDTKAMELGTSKRILEGISRKLEPDSILQAVALPLKEIIPFTSLSLFFIGGRNNLLIVNRDGTTRSSSTDILAHDIIAKLRKTKMVAKEVLERPVEEYVFGKGLVPMGQQVKETTLCYPLVGESGIFGAIHISDGRRDTFDDEEVTFFRNVTSQISLGLSRLFSIREYQDRMEEISRMKADFSSCMSHELRTPITSLKNSIDIMLSGKAGNLDQRQSHFMIMARRDVSRLMDLINNILDLSMLESGNFVINQKELEVIDTLETSLENVKDLTEERSITIVRRVTRSLPRVYADAERLEQILVNLISNAIKFSDTGGKVQVSASLVTDVSKRLPARRKLPQGWKASTVSHNGNGSGSEVPSIEISVRDWGTGISQERLDLIFDKFTQEDSSMTRTFSGAGLGLTLTGYLTTAHNGLLWVESKLGEGSVFRCLLPVCKEESLVREGNSTGIATGEYDFGVDEARKTW